jgi:hypothetical protein
MTHRDEIETYVVLTDNIEPAFLTKNVDKRKQKENIEAAYDIVFLPSRFKLRHLLLMKVPSARLVTNSFVRSK